MDPHSLELLEFDKVRRLLAAYAHSSLGRELAERIEPLRDLAAIRKELALVTELVEELDSGQVPSFSGLKDVRLIVRRAGIGSALDASQLLEVADTLSCTGAIYRYRMRLAANHEGLIELLTPVDDLGGVAKTIQGCIDGRGHVLDMASPELTIVRGKLFDLEEKVKAETRRLLRDPELRKILSYPNVTVHGEHYVLPVAVNHRHKVAGVVHRVSGTGETVFIEPASITGLSAERMNLKAEEDREIKRVLRRLSGEVGRVSKPLIYSLEIIAKLDFLTAKAKYSRDFAMIEPQMNVEKKLWLKSARHPLLEHLFRQSPEPKQVVPIDVRLGLGFNLLIITGPNTGGKTVTLKTTGLLPLMAQSGLHIPAAAGSTVPVFDQILVDIGDEQSLEQSLSTFSSHITRIGTIFSLANERSLVLLDELGAGTDPVEGAALGRAILDQLDEVKLLAMVTTHLGDLKTYAFQNERAENGAVEFDIESLRPTYRLFIGQFGMSNALKIAKRLKLPGTILKRAHRYLKKRRGSGLAKLQQLRQAAEAEKEAAIASQQKLETERRELAKAQALKAKEELAAAEVQQQRKQLKPQDRVHVKRFDAVGVVVRVDLKKETALVSVGFGQWEVPWTELTPQ